MITFNARFKFFPLVGSYKKGTHLQNKRALKVIDYSQHKHFRMEFDAPVPVCIDGEISGAKTIDFTLVRNAFNFVIPKGSSLKYDFNAKLDTEHK